MTENIEPCGCPKIKKTEDELNEPTNYKSKLQIRASDVQAAEPTITNQGVATPSVVPSQIPFTRSLVYALGTPGYDFESEARRDSFLQRVNAELPKPGETFDSKLLDLLKESPEHSESLIWTLNHDSIPVYAIRPMGCFGSKTYELLIEFLKDYLETDPSKKIEALSIPGVIEGNVKLLSGQVVPVIIPELRGMYSWSSHALAKAFVNDESINQHKKDRYSVEEVRDSITNFVKRIYYELTNLGRTSSDRAMNFAATTAYQVVPIFETEFDEGMVLDTIEAERSPVCRPDSDCWYVKLTFFNPEEVLTKARKVFRFTIDVSDVMPVSIGEPVFWSVY